MFKKDRNNFLVYIVLFLKNIFMRKYLGIKVYCTLRAFKTQKEVKKPLKEQRTEICKKKIAIIFLVYIVLFLKNIFMRK
jgi:hypothetical protein